MLNPLELTGRVFVVTGASSGIGLATATLLSQLGATLVLVARNRERLSAALAQMEGGGHHTEEMDLTAPGNLPSWFKTLSEKTGRISGVVHCAGIRATRPLRMLPESEIDTAMKINVNAAIMLAKGFRQKGVCAENGRLVLISSVAGLTGAPGLAAYCAAKGALISLAKSLALEMAPERIRVNCVAPGFVRTPMLKQIEGELGPETIGALEREYPLGFGDPQDIAYAVAFLLGDMGRWVTGTTLVIDGGFTAK